MGARHSMHNSQVQADSVLLVIRSSSPTPEAIAFAGSTLQPASSQRLQAMARKDLQEIMAMQRKHTSIIPASLQSPETFSTFPMLATIVCVPSHLAGPAAAIHRTVRSAYRLPELRLLLSSVGRE